MEENNNENNVTRIPSLTNRDFLRVNAQLYMYCEPVEFENGNKQDCQGFFIPTFIQEEDDFVGLSIDAFREQILELNPPDKDNLLKVQQLMSMMKRFFDAGVLGRKQKLYKKVTANISGSGMAFPSDVAYHAMQQLRICLFFPRYPYNYLTLVGDVVRSEKIEIGYEIKIQFKDMSEKIRDEILKFVNQCQKNSIRHD